MNKATVGIATLAIGAACFGATPAAASGPDAAPGLQLAPAAPGAQLAPAAPGAQAAPGALAPSQGVRIRGVTYRGTGCPPGSARVTLSPDNRSFTVSYSKFVASTGAVAPSARSCQLIVNMEFPQGWSYSIADVEFRGFVALDAGVMASQTATYSFPGTRVPTFATRFVGPVIANYLRRESIEAEALVWSACPVQRPLTINSTINVDNSRNPAGRGILTVDSTELDVRQTFGISWRRCPSP